MATMRKVKRTGLVGTRDARAFTEHKSLARQILSQTYQTVWEHLNN